MALEPLSYEQLPALEVRPELGDVDVAASPEWFGDGWKAFRYLLLRRELATLIAEAGPKDFRVLEVR
ncbi:hypothetical protein [Tenggerimyces flavus]|uniref:Uncharacterized protein n=1 Tax=Tenggerimyces flavus TaxID=1708749 RepID=A0ABV7Y472_9ACTN|nr:hypothetical protein [Tenggerimyces flavus]MBM7790567.1 hypothetical protein [Tenggerimyces flavus]